MNSEFPKIMTIWRSYDGFSVHLRKPGRESVGLYYRSRAYRLDNLSQEEFEDLKKNCIPVLVIKKYNKKSLLSQNLKHVHLDNLGNAFYDSFGCGIPNILYVLD